MPGAVRARPVPAHRPDGGLGFVVGVAGHLTKTRSLVVIGIGLIFLATFVLPLATSVLKNH